MNQWNQKFVFFSMPCRDALIAAVLGIFIFTAPLIFANAEDDQNSNEGARSAENTKNDAHICYPGSPFLYSDACLGKSVLDGPLAKNPMATQMGNLLSIQDVLNHLNPGAAEKKSDVADENNPTQWPEFFPGILPDWVKYQNTKAGDDEPTKYPLTNGASSESDHSGTQ